MDPMKNKYMQPPSPGSAPKAGTKHSAMKAGVETGLSARMDIPQNPSAHGMDTVGVDQKPQACPTESVSKNGNTFKIG